MNNLQEVLENTCGKKYPQVKNFMDLMDLQSFTAKSLLASIFINAADKNELVRALNVCQRCYDNHWKYQIPQIRTARFITDKEYLRILCQEIGIPIPQIISNPIKS
jgi:hypothetical protein